jgi:murein L,D-transpeptidase YcbB/YkuD
MVVIFYDTVYVNSEGIVHFASDIYGYDRALDEALSRGYPYEEIEARPESRLTGTAGPSRKS